MHKPGTLLILTPAFPENETDANWLPARQAFVKALKKHCPQVDPIVVSFRYPDVASEYLWNGVRVISLGGGTSRRLARFLLWIKAWRAMIRLQKREPLTGILSFWQDECSLLGERFARRHGIRHYCWLLGQDAKPGNRYVRLANIPEHRLIALSDFAARSYAGSYGRQPAHTIPVGIDPSDFGQPARERDIDILGTGSMIPLKRYDLFVDVIAKLRVSFPDLRVVLCGGGPGLESIRRKITELELGQVIRLNGETPRAEVLGYMLRTKIFLHPSDYEGFGTVIAEALYAGAQVVSTVTPMNTMPSSHYPATTEQEMISVIAGLLRLGELSHEQVLLYSAREIAEKIAALFGEQPLT